MSKKNKTRQIKEGFSGPIQVSFSPDCRKMRRVIERLEKKKKS